MGHRVHVACMMHGVAGVWWSEQQVRLNRQKSSERIN
jgi:hypothetical protein